MLKLVKLDSTLRRWKPIPVAAEHQPNQPNNTRISIIPFSIRGRRPSQGFTTKLKPVFEE